MPGIVERDQSNKREDVTDMMITAKVNDTPYLAAIRKRREANNTQFEWPVDLPVEPRTTGVPDDQDASDFQDFSPDRTKLKGQLQIFERLPKVSRLANIVSDVAGVGKKKEFARNVAKAISACGLDIETRLLCHDDSAEETNPGTANETRGMSYWINSTAQTHLPVPTAYLTPSTNIFSGAALSTFTEALFIGLMQSKWDATHRKGTLRGFVGSAFKAHVDSWSLYVPDKTSNTTIRRMTGKDKVVSQIVDMLQTSYGDVTLELHPHLFYDGADAASTQTTIGAMFIDMEYVELAFNQRPTRNALPNLGGGPRAQIEAIAGQACTNPLAHTKVYPSGA